MSQVVDTETAREFMKEVLEKVSPEELQQICREVGEKSSWMRERLERDAIPKLSPDEFRSILRRVFSTRRQAGAILEKFKIDDLRAWTGELLYGADLVQARFQTFVDRMEGRRDLAGELLHFTDPQKNWLWARWMWDPKARTGSLPLVTTAAYDYEGETTGEVYLKVGRAVAFVQEVGEVAGFQPIKGNQFGVDVFLSCVYTIYVYTVLRMRMTQEFNKVVPGLPEFCRRILGVHRNGA